MKKYLGIDVIAPNTASFHLPDRGFDGLAICQSDGRLDHVWHLQVRNVALDLKALDKSQHQFLWQRIKSAAKKEADMAIFITQGRFSPDAIRGMLAKPEDREGAIRELFAQSGGKLLAYYMTFGDYDFMIVSGGPFEGVATSAIVAAATGGVSSLKTTLAMTPADMQQAFSRAGQVAAHFKPAGAAAPRTV